MTKVLACNYTHSIIVIVIVVIVRHSAFPLLGPAFFDSGLGVHRYPDEVLLELLAILYEAHRVDVDALRQLGHWTVGAKR